MNPYTKKQPVKPLFSIITVTRNDAANLDATMRSVSSQTCRRYEHLIIDGASTDRTLMVVQKYPQELVDFRSEPDKGIYDGMNKGLAIAEGDYVIFLNSGDTFHSEDTLQRIADIIQENDYPGVVYGQTMLVDKERREIGPRHLTAPEHLTLESFADGMVVCHQAFVALRSLTDFYSRRFHFSADYEWCIRVLQHSRHNILFPGVMIDFLSGGTTARNRRRSLIERFRIMCRYYGVFPTLRRHLKFAVRYLKTPPERR